MSSSLHPKEYTLDTITRGVITILVLLALYFLTRRLSSVLLPFLVSWIIAYMLNPLVNFLQYKCRLKSRGLSIFAAIVFPKRRLRVTQLKRCSVSSVELTMAISSDLSTYSLLRLDRNPSSPLLMYIPCVMVCYSMGW